MPERALIAVGSNIEPEIHLPRALGRLGELGRVIAVSRVYQTPAVGPGVQPDFLNAAALVLTDLSPTAVRASLRAIEDGLGRVRDGDRYAPRTIDLDLCLYGSLVLSTPELTLPDPEIIERAYLATTLAELAPDFPHPITHDRLATIAERLAGGETLHSRADVILPRHL